MKTESSRTSRRSRRRARRPSTATVGETKRSNNLAARMGRWSAGHKKTAIFGWLAFVVAAFMLGNAIGTKKLDPNKAGAGESGHVNAVLADEFKQPQGDSVLIQSTSKTVDDPAFRAAIADVTRTVTGLKQVKKIRSPLVAGNEGQISKDRHTALVTLELRTTDLAKAKTLDAPVEAALVAAATRHPGIAIEEFGVNAEKQLDEAIVSDFKKAGMFSLPITLIVLIFAFGALVAAGLPLLLALSAVLATMGLLAIPSQLMPLDSGIGVIVLLIGLAVGVDYSLFYLKREREERAAGRSEHAALEAAAATSGRAVLISGLTVMVAMAGMLFTGDKTFMGFGIATMIVVAVAVLGSLTVLPALLAALGDNVDRLKVPFVSRLRRPDGGSRMWNAILDRVLRRPLVSAVLAGGLLLALAAPALHMHIATPGLDTLPQNLSAVKTYNKLQKAFPGPVELGPGRGEDRRRPPPGGQDGDRRPAAHRDRDRAVLHPDRGRDQPAGHDRGRLDRGAGERERTRSPSPRSRRSAPGSFPATVGKLDGADVGVTGTTANEQDSNDQLKRATPFVFAFVLTFAFLLMLLTFRSIVVATKAVLLNLLSVGAAYGVLVLVFQDGWGEGLLGFSAHRRDHRVPADLPVRDPVRALDGLPRVHPQPRP